MKKYALIYFFAIILLSQIFTFHCKSKTSTPGILEISGLIEAIDIEIRTQVQGQVKEIFVDEGQFVRSGDLLCILDDEKLCIQLNQVRAGLDGMQSKLRLFKKGTKKEIIVVAENQIETAEKELELARKNQKRMENLFSEGAVSEIEKEIADLKLKTALKHYESAQENYKLAFRGREKEEIEMVEAEIKKLEAQEQFLLRQIQDTKIVSPIDGYLEIRHVESGELVFPGNILFSLIDLNRTYVKAYVPERHLGRIKLGSNVEVICDSFPDIIFKGKVDYISGKAEFAPKNIQTKEERLKLVFMIKSYLENKDRILKQGMPVDVKILQE